MKNKNKTITFDEARLSVEDVISIAYKKMPVRLSEESAFIGKINNSVKFLEDEWKKEGVIYGVTTGYGDSCTRSVSSDLVNELPIHLTRFHGCGMGRYFSHFQSRAIMASRLCSLAKGFSGVSLELLRQIVMLLNHDIAPVIPEEGSVGASGDLTPLSYLAAVLMGERLVTYQGKQTAARDVFNALSIEPIRLKPKEALAIMNGTAAMTAIACEAFHRTVYLCKLAARLTAMTSIALKGNAGHFDENLFAVKPHLGQMRTASRIRSDLKGKIQPMQPTRVQDRYSTRCAPHVIGVVEDSLSWFREMIENELNSSNDNPIIDGEKQLILHGGHFYGGHIAAVMDTMKTQAANLADLIDRQMAVLVDPKFNNGLPANLSLSSGKRAVINHGFKAVQIAVSAWTAEALKNTMPASVFSRSTECHNQDKVSMGTIAARDCLRVLELTEQVFAAHLLALTQAVTVRLNKGELTRDNFSAAVFAMMNNVLEDFELLVEDRPLEETLRRFTQFIRDQRWELYDEE